MYFSFFWEPLWPAWIRIHLTNRIWIQSRCVRYCTVPEGTAGEWGEAKPEDGANISLQRGLQHPVLVREDCLVHKPEEKEKRPVKYLITK